MQIELRPVTLGTGVFTTVLTLPFQRNTTFSRCAGSRQPSPQAPCDPGAAAHDDQEGDLSAAVTITPAAVSLEAPVGTRVRLAYRVSDNGLPRRSAVTYRVIEITSPCGTGQHLCSGECLQVRHRTPSCVRLHAALAAADVELHQCGLFANEWCVAMHRNSPAGNALSAAFFM